MLDDIGLSFPLPLCMCGEFSLCRKKWRGFPSAMRCMRGGKGVCHKTKKYVDVGHFFYHKWLTLLKRIGIRETRSFGTYIN
jgi:hypothetical protein